MIINLEGPQGNAWALMATALNIAKQLDMDGKAITAEMQERDYKHLLDVFEKHFGHVVTLVNRLED